MDSEQTAEVAVPVSYKPPDLHGKVALVAGASRGAGRGIAVALGEAGATVYCTGRSSRLVRGAPRRPGDSSSELSGRLETIEETAERVTVGISAVVDHASAAAVQALLARIEQEQGKLDILVNAIWGGDALLEFGKVFWQLDLERAFG